MAKPKHTLAGPQHAVVQAALAHRQLEIRTLATLQLHLTADITQEVLGRLKGTSTEHKVYPGFCNICPNGLHLGFLVPTPIACWVHANMSQNATNMYVHVYALYAYCKGCLPHPQNRCVCMCARSS